jgi:hypothetical protein
MQGFDDSEACDLPCFEQFYHNLMNLWWFEQLYVELTTTIDMINYYSNVFPYKQRKDNTQK